LRASDAVVEPETITVRLDATGADLSDPSAVATQIPAAGGLAARTRVSVLPTALRRSGVLGRILGPREVPVGRAARCTALLVRGYVDVAADDTSAWGFAP
jgi:hypothetical protein